MRSKPPFWHFYFSLFLEALKRKGKRTDLTSDPLGPKLGYRSNEEVAEQVGDSKSQVKRYIRLTELTLELLDMVDEGKIALRPAVELSYLSKEEQELVQEACFELDCTPSHAQTIGFSLW